MSEFEIDDAPKPRERLVTFEGVARFRTLDGDMDILKAAAKARGQTFSAYLRDVSIEAALRDLQCSNRENAHRKIRRRLAADE